MSNISRYCHLEHDGPRFHRRMAIQTILGVLIEGEYKNSSDGHRELKAGVLGLRGYCFY